jgi:LDH2 family malate/lactate/ureidoglycolate dehydrogenase
LETISIDLALSTSIRALEKAGVAPENAKIQADLLLEAELRGRASHGLQRLPRIIQRIENAVADPDTVGVSTWNGTSLLEVDGCNGLGPVVAFNALAQISARARETGVAAATVSHCNHIGMLALYAQRIAEQGQILIAMTTSEALVHPWGGRKAMIGTNPIAIGVPATPLPFVLDMATSLVSMGQVHDYANRGQALQPGWALDIHGDPTLDAKAARDGAIAPFGDAKGYALGLAIEVLVASLTGCGLGTDVKGTLDNDQPCNKGDIFIVLQPAHNAAHAISTYLNAIRECEPAKADRPVLVPGDRAHEVRRHSLVDGIRLPAGVWQQIRVYAGE